jgi:hypothetical protein
MERMEQPCIISAIDFSFQNDCILSEQCTQIADYSALYVSTASYNAHFYFQHYIPSVSANWKLEIGHAVADRRASGCGELSTLVTLALWLLFLGSDRASRRRFTYCCEDRRSE